LCAQASELVRGLPVADNVACGVIFDRSTVSARCPLFTRYLPNCCITATAVPGQQWNWKVVDTTVLIPAFFLKLDLAIVLISLTYIASPTAAPRQASVAESSVALPPISVESRHAPLNPRHRMPAASTGQHAGPNMPLLRRHHAASPDDPKTWSAFGTVHLRLPFLRTGRYKVAKWVTAAPHPPRRETLTRFRGQMYGSEGRPPRRGPAQ
jgi:hypothetical protein